MNNKLSMNKLPVDIIREHILPYTYLPQTKELCDDVKSFTSIKTRLRQLYYDRWKDTFQYEENADLNWLDNDLIRFLNDDVATMNGFTDKCVKKYSRLYVLRNSTNEAIFNYIYNHTGSNQTVTYSINLQLGILTPSERDEFTSFAHTIN